MNGLEQYISKIKKKATKHLSEEYQTDKFSLNDFELEKPVIVTTLFRSKLTR